MAAVIRPYQDIDLDGIRNLIPAIQQKEFNVAVTWEDQTDLHDIPAFYRKGNGEFWVADDKGKVVGSIALIDTGDGFGTIRKMFVAKEYRGPSPEDGISLGLKLLNTLVAHAQSHQMTHLYLGTVDQLKAAQRFYLREGFHEIDPDDLPKSFPRMFVDTRFYARQLIP